MFRIYLLRLIAVAAFTPGVVNAAEIVLDYTTVARLASQRAPAVVAARGQVGEAKGRRAGAAVLLPSNPELQVSGGRRYRADSDTTDLELGVGQGFELGGKRSARISAADAGIAHAEAEVGEALRTVLHEAAMMYYQALAGKERRRLAQDSLQVALEVVQATERRLVKGDALDLEVSLAKSALGRARAAVHAANADDLAVLGQLRALLALDPADTVVVSGSFANVRQVYDLNRLLAKASRRPELAAYAAEEAEGKALLRLGQAYRWPDLQLGAAYAREEQADIVLAKLSISLPFFERGQEHRQVGQTKRLQATNARQALWRSIKIEVRAAFEAYAERCAAVASFTEDVIPTLDQNDRLLRKSYEAGQISLADFLATRRELLDARHDYLQRLIEMAEASVNLELAAGILQ